MFNLIVLKKNYFNVLNSYYIKIKQFENQLAIRNYDVLVSTDRPSY